MAQNMCTCTSRTQNDALNALSLYEVAGIFAPHVHNIRTQRVKICYVFNILGIVFIQQFKSVVSRVIV